MGRLATSVKPHRGPQELFLSSPADVAIYGGSAGSGKTFAELLEATRYTARRLYRAIGFRRTRPRITKQGGLWDASTELYPFLGATPYVSRLEWVFPSGATIRFDQLQHEADKKAHDGAEYDHIFFDEITEFTETQFWYLTSRLRSRCGVKPYVRGACNPDPDSFVKGLISWWLDDEGYPIEERSGVLRYLIRDEDSGAIQWVGEDYEGDERPMSFTFVAAKVTDNYTLMRSNPQYVDQLKKLDRTERERKLYGNWNIRDEKGMLQREWFRVVDALPADVELVRYWDRAATAKTSANDPCYTAGCLGGHSTSGVFYIADIRRARLDPADNQMLLQNTASQDGESVPIYIEQEPGSSGKDSIYHYVAHVLPEYDVHGDRVTGDKVSRAKPLAAQAEVGNVRLVSGPWVEPFLKEAANFPVGRHKDQIDAVSGCYTHSLKLVNNSRFFIGRAR